MKWNVIRSLFAFLLFGIFNALTVSEAKAQPILQEILKRMEAHRSNLTSLQASVTMSKFDKVVDETDNYEGSVAYLPLKGKDPLIRIDWTKPAAETFAVAGGKYVIFRPRLKQAIVGKTKEAKGSGKAGGALSFMNMSKDELKTNYTIKYLGQENISGSIPTWHLQLTPKTAASYNSAELWVDGNGMPLQAKVFEKNGDATTVLLSGLQKNVTFNASRFKVDLPKGTKIING